MVVDILGVDVMGVDVLEVDFMAVIVPRHPTYNMLRK